MRSPAWDCRGWPSGCDRPRPRGPAGRRLRRGPAWPPSSCHPRLWLARVHRRPPWRHPRSGRPVLELVEHAEEQGQYVGLAGDANDSARMAVPGYLGTCRLTVPLRRRGSPRRRGVDLPEGGLHQAGELGRHGVGLGLPAGFDHDTHDGFGAARAQEDPPFHAGWLRPRRPRPTPAGRDTGARAVGGSATLTRRCGTRSTRPAERSPSVDSERSIRSANAIPVRMPSPVVDRCRRKMMWPDCSPPRLRPSTSSAASTWRSPTSVSRACISSALHHGEAESEVGHDGDDHRVRRQTALGGEVQGEERQEDVPVDDGARAVDRHDSVCVAVEQRARGRPGAPPPPAKGESGRWSRNDR